MKNIITLKKLIMIMFRRKNLKHYKRLKIINFRKIRKKLLNQILTDLLCLFFFLGTRKPYPSFYSYSYFFYKILRSFSFNFSLPPSYYVPKILSYPFFTAIPAKATPLFITSNGFNGDVFYIKNSASANISFYYSILEFNIVP